jgi:hypothetical protein
MKYKVFKKSEKISFIFIFLAFSNIFFGDFYTGISGGVIWTLIWIFVRKHNIKASQRLSALALTIGDIHDELISQKNFEFEQETWVKVGNRINDAGFAELDVATIGATSDSLDMLKEFDFQTYLKYASLSKTINVELHLMFCENEDERQVFLRQGFFKSGPAHFVNIGREVDELEAIFKANPKWTPKEWKIVRESKNIFPTR